jgi:TRAP-type C4-dicarboxylate transport system permease small subunit
MDRRSKSERLTSVAMGVIKSGQFLSAYVLLSVMISLMALDPIMRYLFGAPFFWSNEVTTYLMVAMVFNGFGIALLTGQHISINLIFDRLPPKAKNLMWIIISVAGLFYACLIGYALTLLAISSFTFQVRSPTAQIPILPWQIIAIWGLIGFLTAFILFTIRRIAIASGSSRVKIRFDKSTEF